MSFNPKGKAVIEALEFVGGKADDATTSLHMTIRMEDQSAEVTAAALGADSAEEVENSYHRPVSQDADRNPRYFGMKKTACTAKWENRHAVKFKQVRQVRVSRIGTISFIPKGRAKFELHFDLVIDQPPAGYADTLGQYLHQPIDCEFEHDTELPLSQPEGGQSGLPPEPKKANQIRTGRRAMKPKPAGKSMGKKPTGARKAKPKTAAVH